MPWKPLILLGTLLASAGQAQQDGWPAVSAENCSWIAAPEQVQMRGLRARREAYERTLEFARSLPKMRAARTVHASELPVRNFIDEEIFARLQAEGVPAAPIAGDEEFLRRVTLDLTGRIPSPADIRAFVADQAPDKRDRLIDRLLASEEFIDKWTLWLGDLFQNAAIAQNRSQQINGRNAFYRWIRNALKEDKSWRDIATEIITINGNNYDAGTAGTNFLIRGFAPMGPAQDTYDLLLVKTASTFLGIGHYDCLLCHNGKYHLDMVSAWGAKVTRLEAQQMAAHFARISMTARRTDTTDYYYQSWDVSERSNGAYVLNTNAGNRPNRAPALVDGRTVTNLTPVYRDGRPATGNWRESLVRAMIADPMFTRNYANRVWKAMFGLALAEPVDGLDPARLDPRVAPPEGWTYQASHPWLLEKLAEHARSTDFHLRETLRLIARSTAYQLSSRYDGDWDITKAPLFARRLPRRLDAEEIHDAIVKATQLPQPYTVQGFDQPFVWAVQLPDTSEPRSNGTTRAFLDAFNRGNRDTLQRNRDGSILMWLTLMNSPFTNNRARASGANASPLLAALARSASNEQIVEEMFLTFLSRQPTPYERGVALKTLEKAATAQARVTAVEDLAWALMNRIEFLFSY
ncbi:MAG: hypothetical protein KatS3mg004_1725 [Bryobacteraceae bacterium]|nr:MAG: hypothetical protein KatS3mg004_1725 [Bryobacteraceae bacterium]